MRRTLTVVLAALLLSACGNGAGSTSEDYFADLAQIQQRANAAANAVQDRVSDQAATQRSQTDARALYLEAIGDVVDGYAQTLEAVRQLTPPEEVAGEHDRFVAAIQEQVDTDTRILHDIRSDPDADPSALLEAHGAQISQREEAVTAACAALQDRADALGVKVDLACGS